MNAPFLQEVTPVFPVGDVDATGDWYREVLGFEYHPFPETPPASFAILSREGVEIFLQLVEGYRKPDLASRRPGGVWDAYIQVTGLSTLWEGLERLPGARGPEDRFYGQREVEVRDLNGYLLVFAERITGGAS